MSGVERSSMFEGPSGTLNLLGPQFFQGQKITFPVHTSRSANSQHFGEPFKVEIKILLSKKIFILHYVIKLKFFSVDEF